MIELYIYMGCDKMWYDYYKRNPSTKRNIYKCPICGDEYRYKGICSECRKNRKEDVEKHIALLEKRRKYTCGELLTSVDSIFDYNFVYVNGKITHIGFLCSMPTRVVYNLVKSKRIFIANKKETAE